MVGNKEVYEKIRGERERGKEDPNVKTLKHSVRYRGDLRLQER